MARIRHIAIATRDPEATYESVVKAFNDDGSVPESGLRLAVEEARRLGKVQREVPMSEVSELSILREAHRELENGGR